MRTRSIFPITIILILSSLLFASSAWAKMEIIFPMSQNMKAVSNIHVIGRADSNLPVRIDINGSIMDKKLIRAKDKEGNDYYMLMTILRLDDGVNNITITQGEDAQKFVINRIDSAAKVADWTEGLNGFHSSTNKEICLNCHRFENLSDCVNCHSDKFLGAWVHKPVAEAKCFFCHEKENNFVPKEPFAETCLKCHTAMQEKIDTMPMVHAPVIEGYCTICHSPHKSTNRTHLRKPPSELCFECHDSASIHSTSYMKVHPTSGVKVEKLNKEIDCADCHSPHFSDNDKLLSVEGGREALCAKCHEPEEAKDLLEALEGMASE